MEFEWKNPKDDIHVCNNGAAQVQPGKERGTYRAEIFRNGSSVAKLERFSSLQLAKQAAEIQLEKLGQRSP